MYSDVSNVIEWYLRYVICSNFCALEVLKMQCNTVLSVSF